MNTVRMWSASTNLVSTVAGTGGKAAVSADGFPGNVTALSSPSGIVVLPTYDVLVVESTAHRIRFISAGGGTVSTWAGSTDGLYGFLGDGGPATSALLYNPQALARDFINGDVYFSDMSNYRIRVVRANGTMQTAVGSGGNGFLDSWNAAAALTSDALLGLDLDGAGNLLFVDRQVMSSFHSWCSLHSMTSCTCSILAWSEHKEQSPFVLYFTLHAGTTGAFASW